MATIRDRYVLEVETDKATKGISGAGAAVGGLATKLKGLGPLAAGAAAALGGLAAIRGIGNTIDSMDELAKSARQAGAAADAVSFEKFQVFGRVLEEAGIGSERFALALSQTQDRLAKGGGKIDDVIAKLGDSIKDMNGELLSGPELLERMILAFNNGEISAEEFQATVGTKVGPEIIRALGDTAASAENLQAAFQDVAENSNIIDLEAAQNAESFNDTMGRLQEVAGRLGSEIVERLLPVLMNLAEGALAVLPSIIDGVSAAFDAMSPIIDALSPIVGALFDLLQALWPVFETLLGAIAPVAEIIGGALSSAIQGITTVIETVIGVITTMIERIRGIADSVSEVTGAVGQKWNSMTDGLKNGAKDAYEGVTGWFGQMADEVVGNSIIPDMAEAVLTVFRDMNRGMVEETNQGASGVLSGFDAVAGNVGAGFNQYATDALLGIASLIQIITNDSGNLIRNLDTGIAQKIAELQGLNIDPVTQQGQVDGLRQIGMQATQGQVELANTITDTQNTFTSGWKTAFDTFSEDANNSAKAAERIFSKVTTGMEDMIVSFAKTGKFEFKEFAASVLEDLLRLQVRQSIAGIFGGGTGTGFNLTNPFAGFFANGGTIPAGQFGVVGEAGPEFVSGPATVTPMGAGLGAQQVTYIIQAVDAPSFQALVARDPGFIHAVAQQGAKKVPVRR